MEILVGIFFIIWFSVVFIIILKAKNIIKTKKHITGMVNNVFDEAMKRMDNISDTVFNDESNGENNSAQSQYADDRFNSVHIDRDFPKEKPGKAEPKIKLNNKVNKKSSLNTKKDWMYKDSLNGGKPRGFKVNDRKIYSVNPNEYVENGRLSQESRDDEKNWF